MPYRKYAEFIGFDYLKFDIKVSNSKIYHIKFPFSPEKICMYIDPNKSLFHYSNCTTLIKYKIQCRKLELCTSTFNY